MSKLMDKVKNMDLYLLLEVEADADENTIKKAYRKKALKCHPDKNPDNPKAAELFHQLSEALSVLTDDEARKAYDNVLKAKKANELRNRKLDAKRKKMKDELEAREKAAFEEKADDVLAGEKLKTEIERLQKEGQRQLEEEQERLRQMLNEEKVSMMSKAAESSKKLKVRWKGSHYDEDRLRQLFCKYGDVGDVVVLENKKEKGKFSALIEMMNGSAAKMAVNIERGDQDHPFKKIELLEDKSGVETQSNPTFSAPNPSSYQPPQPQTTFNDFESLVMRQLRQAEERKRLIEEIENNE